MDPIGVFSGIVSGIDFQSLVDEIMTLERRPLDRIELQIDQTKSRLSTFQEFRRLLDTFQSSATSLRDGSAFEGVGTTVAGTTAGGVPILSASADAGTPPGSYDVEVLSLAKAEKVSGSMFQTDSDPLNIAGEFFVGGSKITIDVNDSLTSIRDKVNAANSGNSATGVTASILSTGSNVKRLILTSDQTGASGIDLIDTSDGVLSQLGLIDSTTVIKHGNSAGADSDHFAARSTAIASLLGLANAPTSQDITIAGQTVAIDLSTDSLDDIAAAIDALTGVTATVQTTTLDDGTFEYYLDVRGTTSFTDAGNTLEMLGLLERGRSAVAHSITANALTAGDAVTPATAGTLLTNLFANGQAATIQTGDTFTIAGTRGDGTAVNLTYTVAGGDTVQDVLDFLNNASNGFGAGTRTATASIDANGQILLADDTAGDSQLSLAITSHNEGGGSMDFGLFSIAELGRAREVVAGSDATLRVDGVTLTRSSNKISDIVPGVRLTLHAAEVGTTVNVVVGRSADAALSVMQGFVKSFNSIASFVEKQLVLAEEGAALPPLYGDSTLRITRNTIVSTLLRSVSDTAADLSTVASVGISIDEKGVLSLNETLFRDMFDTRYNDLFRLFSEQGSATDGEVDFITASGTAAAGTYAVDITAPATQATTLGSGFSGTYADDGTADSITVTQALTGGQATVALTNGMTTAQIVDALNVSFATPTNHQLVTSNQMFSDVGTTTPVDSLTTFDSLFTSGGVAAGVTAGDTISFTGIRANGTSFNSAYTVTDPAVDTLGDFVTTLQAAYGDTTTVSIVDGSLTITDNTAGSSVIALSIGENNEGGGVLDFGNLDVAESGRGVMSLTAEAVGNEIQITHHAYGSSPGFTVAFAGGGADGTAQLGVAAATYNGTDVTGTIGGFAATGAGQQLIADASTPIAGLQVRYSGTTARAAGDVRLTVGVGATLERFLDGLLDVGNTFDLKEEAMENQLDSLDRRIDPLQARLDARRAAMLQRFANMEVLLSQLQGQSTAFQSQVAQLIPPRRNDS